MTETKQIAAPEQRIAFQEETSPGTAMVPEMPEDIYSRLAAQLMFSQPMWDGFMQRCDAIAQTRLYGHKTSSTVMIAALKGFELGWSLMQALERVKVIAGTPTIRGPAAVGMIRAAGYYMACTESTSEHAVWVCRRDGYPEQTFRYDYREAEKAGLTVRNENWERYPSECCKWAAATRASKEYFTEVLAGFEIAESMRYGLVEAPEHTSGEPEEPPKGNWDRDLKLALHGLIQKTIEVKELQVALGSQEWNELKAFVWGEVQTKADLPKDVPQEEGYRRLLDVMGIMRKELER